MSSVNAVGLKKGDEMFVFLFPDSRRSEAIRSLGKMASNKEINFSWYDAAVLSSKIRQIEDNDG